MKVKLLQDYDISFNEKEYKRGEILEVYETKSFPSDYEHYWKTEDGETIDWIPKEICEVLND